MTSKPFEIVAECEIMQLPMEADFAGVREKLEATRRRHPGIVSTAVTNQAVLRDLRYLATARFVAWAEHSTGAMEAVEALIRDSGLGYRNVLPSGRLLSEAETPPHRYAAPKPAMAARAETAAKRGAPVVKPSREKAAKGKSRAKRVSARAVTRKSAKPGDRAKRQGRGAKTGQVRRTSRGR
ncbi:MAG: hypothetical protein ACT4P5_02770 [Armatimonadota bacterium]